MVTENINVDKKIANGAVGKFKGVTLKNSNLFEKLDKIIIDGYYVRCISVEHLHSIQIELIEELDDNQEPTVIDVKPKEYYANVRFPINIDSKITHTTTRPRKKAMKLKQFPVNLASARTVHKLQGQSIKNIFISSWDYTGNWIYVVLSRCNTIKGIFMRKKLNHDKIQGTDMKALDFYRIWREKKTHIPNDPQDPFIYF